MRIYASFQNKFLSLCLFAFFIMMLSSSTFADPPTRVARVGFIEGNVSLLPSGETYWIDAFINRPLSLGDRLWIDNDGKSELQLGGSALRIWSGTDLSVLKIDTEMSQFGLNQGSVNLHVWKMKANQQFEIDTPNLAFIVSVAGDYRVDVDAANNTTTIMIRHGQAAVYGENIAYTLDENQTYTFTGADLSQYTVADLSEPDQFDLWCESRNKRSTAGISSRYVANTVIGYEDLDEYGKWYSEPSYGSVWVPNDVPDDWAPYRDGSWMWQDPWGWTWVDSEPWGFAPYHYGRWAFVSDRWIWIPGRIDIEPIYAPALVVFFSGPNFQINISIGGLANGIGWLPLGPTDVYIPPYNVTQNYFNNINISNTYINNQIINNVYINQNAKRDYQNLKVHNAVTAIPVTSFVKGEPVKKVEVPVTKDMLPKADIKHKIDLMPTPASLIGPSAPTKIKPPKDVGMKPLIVKTAPIAPSQQPVIPADTFKKIKVITPPVKPTVLKPTEVKPVPQGIKPVGPADVKPVGPQVIKPVTPKDIKPVTPPQVIKQPGQIYQPPQGIKPKEQVQPSRPQPLQIYQPPQVIKQPGQLYQPPKVIKQPGQPYQPPQVIKQPGQIYQPPQGIKPKEQVQPSRPQPLQIYQPPQVVKQPSQPVKEVQQLRQQYQLQQQQRLQPQQQIIQQPRPQPQQIIQQQPRPQPQMIQQPRPQPQPQMIQQPRPQPQPQIIQQPVTQPQPQIIQQPRPQAITPQQAQQLKEEIERRKALRQNQ